MDYDTDVISRAVRRDENAFAEIYTAQSPQVFRYIYYLTGNYQEADDLTSEVFLKAWQAIHRYEDRGFPISSWLVRIAHNLTMKQLKRRRPRISLDDIELRADERYSPHSVFTAGVEAETVRRAVLQLPDIQRQVIICRFIEHMSYEEVEAVVGKSAGAVRVIQHRAIQRLREALAVGNRPDVPMGKRRIAEIGA